jgi:hypothetical protein
MFAWVLASGMLNGHQARDGFCARPKYIVRGLVRAEKIIARTGTDRAKISFVQAGGQKKTICSALKRGKK